MVFSDYISPYFAAILALYVVELVGFLVLVGLAFGLCQPRIVAGTQRPTCFGFRWAVILAAFASLVAVTALAVSATALSGDQYMVILSIFGLLAGVISKAVLAYAVIRVALHPLREAGFVNRDKLLARSVAIIFTLITIILTGLELFFEARKIQYGQGKARPQSIDISAQSAVYVMDFINVAVYTIIGAIGLGTAIFAHRKSRNLEVYPGLCKGVKLMMTAGSIWTGQGLLATILSALSASYLLYAAGSLYSSPVEVTLKAIEVLQQLVTYSLFVVCFRKPKSNEVLPM